MAVITRSRGIAILNQASQLRSEFETWQALYAAQPAPVQRFLEEQGRAVSTAFLEPGAAARFGLPDHVVIDPFTADTYVPVPVRARGEVVTGSLVRRLIRADSGPAVRARLAELERSADPAVAVSAGLVRYATARHMIHEVLPAGRSVTYSTLPGEEVPSIPPAVRDAPRELASGLTAPTDVIAGDAQLRGQAALPAPFVPAARRFFLPQWVALDESDRLVVGSLEEARAYVAAMARFVAILQAAVALAPYFVVDDVYQQKRYGMLGQLVNQGRALARFQTQEIVRIIRERAAAQTLNRGFGFNLPYFDDEALEMRVRSVEVVPQGRITFIPAFVVRAVRLEQAKVAQDARLSPSTSSHLLAQLATLERAFSGAAGEVVPA